MKEKLFLKWENDWRQEKLNGNKLGEIKQSVEKWKNINNLTRKEQSVLTRARIGHTNLTQIHLIKREDPPV